MTTKNIFRRSLLKAASLVGASAAGALHWSSALAKTANASEYASA